MHDIKNLLDLSDEPVRKGTGPTTEAGKNVSRRNAFKHGLSGDGVVLAPDDAAKVAARVVRFREMFRPANEAEMFYVGQYALETVRVELCQAQEQALRSEAARRAEDRAEWKCDRCLDAEEIAARLAKDPALVIQRLRQTIQGCEWMIRRWEVLSSISKSGRAWDEAEKSLALDMIGFPATLRNASTPLDPEEGVDRVEHERREASGQLADLNILREHILSRRDQQERFDVLAGADPCTRDLAHRLKLVRRYESACQRRLKESLKQIYGVRMLPARGQTIEAHELLASLAPPADTIPTPDFSRKTAAPPPRPPAVAAAPKVDIDIPIVPPQPPTKPQPLKGNRAYRREQARRARRSAA